MHAHINNAQAFLAQIMAIIFTYIHTYIHVAQAFLVHYDGNGIYVHTCTHTYTHTCTHTHTHTYIHTHCAGVPGALRRQ